MGLLTASWEKSGNLDLHIGYEPCMWQSWMDISTTDFQTIDLFLSLLKSY